jgi:DUF3043 family protein
MARGTRSDNADMSATSPEDDPETVARKNRATPKRTEARQLRAQERKAAPKNRKEAASARREAMRAARESLNSTDVSKLPKRERQPELVYARDLVDSRFYASQAVFWLMILSLVVSFVVQPAIFVTFLVFFVLIATSWFEGRKIAAKVRSRYPDSTVPVQFYSARRMVSPRRLRKPVTRVTRGAEVR